MDGNRYIEFVKPFSFFFAVGCITLLAGCSVEIYATQAVASAASPKEIQGDSEASSARPDGAGVWVALKALIRREDVERVVRRQVYPHVYLVECSSGRETNVGTEPRLEGIQFADFDAVRGVLTKHPAKRAFEMRSLVFARAKDFEMPQCLQFRGGSYTGQRLIETRIQIRVIGRLPQNRFPPSHHAPACCKRHPFRNMLAARSSSRPPFVSSPQRGLNDQPEWCRK